MRTFLPTLALYLLALSLGACLTGQATAGPWLRTSGETFLSFSVEVSDPDDFYVTAYGEYGLRPDLTLGLDLGIKDNGLDKAIAFALRALTGPESVLQVALALGVGISDDKGVLRPGVNIGRGVTLGQRNGWVALELYAVINPDDAEHYEHIDLTLGMDLSAHSKAMFQVFSNGNPVDGEGLKMGPSLIIAPNPGQYFQIGVLAGIRDTDDTAIKLGVWRNF